MVVRLDTSVARSGRPRRAPGRVSLGQVVLLRDLMAMEDLRSRLTAMQAMTDALRAQRHEFANRLHTVSPGCWGDGERGRARGTAWPR
ncbi:hypothetical protein QJS66_16990 [Kocuria rhizophila]|nr:hypothetical protein QJS66_16990 [Kocuria rhizophila]